MIILIAHEILSGFSKIGLYDNYTIEKAYDRLDRDFLENASRIRALMINGLIE